jgi:hypothetical protein
VRLRRLAEDTPKEDTGREDRCITRNYPKLTNSNNRFRFIIVIQPYFCFCSPIYRSSPIFRPVSSFGEPPVAAVGVWRQMLPGIRAAGKFTQLAPFHIEFIV